MSEAPTLALPHIKTDIWLLACDNDQVELLCGWDISKQNLMSPLRYGARNVFEHAYKLRLETDPNWPKSEEFAALFKSAIDLECPQIILVFIPQLGESFKSLLTDYVVLLVRRGYDLETFRSLLTACGAESYQKILAACIRYGYYGKAEVVLEYVQDPSSHIIAAVAKNRPDFAKLLIAHPGSRNFIANISKNDDIMMLRPDIVLKINELAREHLYEALLECEERIERITNAAGDIEGAK